MLPDWPFRFESCETPGRPLLSLGEPGVLGAWRVLAQGLPPGYPVTVRVQHRPTDGERSRCRKRWVTPSSGPLQEILPVTHFDPGNWTLACLGDLPQPMGWRAWQHHLTWQSGPGRPAAVGLQVVLDSLWGGWQPVLTLKGWATGGEAVQVVLRNPLSDTVIAHLHQGLDPEALGPAEFSWQVELPDSSTTGVLQGEVQVNPWADGRPARFLLLNPAEGGELNLEPGGDPLLGMDLEALGGLTTALLARRAQLAQERRRIAQLTHRRVHLPPVPRPAASPFFRRLRAFSQAPRPVP
ncbi:MAG: hypothetical protein IGQ88_09490 [Gloeomargaritaceae cyanobacterium C42_A2020_066]|nr:hypothetical protein [Gloeomargaritaceae cyanobacterium C42_A2020_066]